MTDNEDNGVVKTNSAEIKRRSSKPRGGQKEKKNITVADLPKDVPRDALGQVNVEAEVSPEAVLAMGGLDPQSMIEHEENRRMAHGQQVQIGQQLGMAGWDRVIYIVKTNGLWPRGRVDIKSLQPPEDCEPILDPTMVETGPALYEYLMRVHARDVPRKVECTYLEGQKIRLKCLFNLPAKQQQQPQPQAYGQPSPGGWPQYPGASAFPPPQAPGYTYPPQPGMFGGAPQPAQPAQPPMPPALPPQAVQQGMSAQEVSQMMQQQGAYQMQMLEWMRQQQQPAPAPAQPAYPPPADPLQQMQIMAGMMKDIFIPMMQGSGAVPAPAKTPLEQITDMAAIIKVGKEMLGISTDDKTATPESPVTLIDGPGDLKIPLNNKDGELNKTVAIMMGVGSALEEIKGMVGPLVGMKMQQMQMATQVQQPQNPQVQMPQVPALGAGLPQQTQQPVQTQGQPVLEDDDNDPL